MADQGAKGEAWKSGQEFGAALAELAGGINPALDVQAATVVGMKFAALEGYRDLQLGMAYVSGFVQGLQGNPRRQISQGRTPRESSPESEE